MAQGYKRRLIPIVDRRFQFKYTAIIVLVAAAVSTVLGAFLWRSYTESNQIIELASLSPGIGDQLNAEDTRTVFRLCVAFLVAEVGVFGLLGLVITHRVAGPVFVIHRHLVTLAEGAFPRLRTLRAGDEFQSTFEALHSVVDQLRRREQIDLDRLKGLLEAAQAKSIGEADIATLRELVEEHEAHLSESA